MPVIDWSVEITRKSLENHSKSHLFVRKRHESPGSTPVDSIFICIINSTFFSRKSSFFNRKSSFFNRNSCEKTLTFFHRVAVAGALQKPTDSSEHLQNSSFSMHNSSFLVQNSSCLLTCIRASLSAYSAGTPMETRWFCIKNHEFCINNHELCA